MSAQDEDDEENDNEMQNYEGELQQCAQAVGINYQRQEEAVSVSDNATEPSKASKKRKRKQKLQTRPMSQEDAPLPENVTTRILSEVYKEGVFEEMAHLAAFKARFQQQMGQPKRRLALEEHTKMLWHQVIIYSIFTNVAKLC